MHLFYYGVSNLQISFNSGDRDISLSGDDATHLKVLRMRQGDTIYVTDGTGNICKADIQENSPKFNSIRLLDLRTYERPRHSIHIMIAPPKNVARFEWFLEKATEAGIDEITPFFSEHSERAVLRSDRLNKVLVSAMKQSLKPFLPKLNEPVSFKSIMNSKNQVSNGFIAWLDRQNEQQHLKAVCGLHQPTTILIGPEGDFSQEEVDAAKLKGFVPVSLGSSRLRTETAALAACFIVNILNEPDVTGYPLSLE